MVYPTNLKIELNRDPFVKVRLKPNKLEPISIVYTAKNMPEDQYLSA